MERIARREQATALRLLRGEAARPKKNKIEWLFIVYFYILFVTCITFYNFIINFT
jgi:hypothetical protein